MRKLITRTIWLAFFITMISVAEAQLIDPPMPMGRKGGPMRDQVKDKIKTIKVWKLTEKLDMDETQSQRFFPLYNKFFDTWESIQISRGEIIQRLDELVQKDGASESDINRQLNRLDSLDRAGQDARIKFRNDIKGVLTTKQIGQLYVFEVKFMMEMRDIIGDARQEMRGRHQGREPND
jgi:Spy/CpxP family protein refolding chaperone